VDSGLEYSRNDNKLDSGLCDSWNNLSKKVDLRPDTSKMTVCKFAGTSRYPTILSETVSGTSK
jgi:hypothetical protein